MLNRSAQNSFLALYGMDWSQENVDAALTMDTTITRSLVVDRYFRDHVDEMAEIIRDGLMHQAALGQTSFSSHIVGLRIHDGYMNLVRAGKMPIRFGYADRFCQQVEPDMAGCFVRKGDVAGLGDEYFFNVGVTLGGIDSGPPNICTTMEAEAKYKSAEQCILTPGSEYDKAISAAVRSRLRYIVNHVYGDKAVDYFMDSVDRVVASSPTLDMNYIRSRRLTADHCGFYPRQEQLPRIKNMGMVISCDPMFLDRSFPWLDVYGKDKANRIGPIASMIKAGIMPTAESEVNVESGTGPTYFAHQIHFITRKNSKGVSVAPEEAVDRVQLMKMMTTWASHFTLKEKEMGTLEPGKYADFAVLSKDYFSVPEAEIPTIVPLATFLGGKNIVLRKELADELGTQPLGPQLNFKFATEFASGGGE
jgi:predicted amidohydrolase YtcJ